MYQGPVAGLLAIWVHVGSGHQLCSGSQGPRTVRAASPLWSQLCCQPLTTCSPGMGNRAPSPQPTDLPGCTCLPFLPSPETHHQLEAGSIGVVPKWGAAPGELEA